MISLWVPGLPPSVNDERRAHWSVRHAKVREWDAWVAAQVRAAGVMRHAETPARLTLEFHGTRYDAGNLEKHATDSLVRAGLLADDRWPWLVELTVRARPCAKGGEGVAVEIADAVDDGEAVRHASRLARAREGAARRAAARGQARGITGRVRGRPTG